MVGPGRNSQPPPEEWPTVQEWYDIRDIAVRDTARQCCVKFIERPGRDVGRARNATLI
jgi:hypothetical protein